MLLTGAPGCPTESATGSRQCNSLQCSLVQWLRPARSYSPYKTRQTCQRDEATGQPRQTKQQTNSGTNQPPDAKGGSHCGGCVWDVGPAALGLSKLTSGTAHQNNIKTGRADQKHKTTTAHGCRSRKRNHEVPCKSSVRTKRCSFSMQSIFCIISGKT